MRQLSDCLPLFLDWKFAHSLRSDSSLVRILHFHSVGIFLCWNFAFSLDRDFFLAKTLHVQSAEICGLSVQLLPINIHCCVHILRLHYFPFLFCKAMYCCKYLPNISRACLACWHVGWPAQYNTWLLSQRVACKLSRLPLLILSGIGTLTLCILKIRIICSFTKFNASTVLRSFLSSPHLLAFKALTRWTSRSPH